MQYTLISGNGKVYTFFIRAVAETYQQQAYGGVVVTQQVLSTQKELTINSQTAIINT
jgi:hypothetical protein